MRYVVLLYEACLMLKNIWIFILNVKFDRYCDIVIRIVKKLEIDKKFLKFYLKSTSRKYECCAVFLLASVFSIHFFTMSRRDSYIIEANLNRYTDWDRSVTILKRK